MKYLIFALAVSGVLPAALIMAGNRRLLRVAAFCIPVSALVFSEASINFFSHEFYRGTARGMEIAATYLAAIVVLLALLLRRGRLTVKMDFGMVCYLLLFAASVLSCLNAEDLLFSFFELWKMVMMFLVFIAVWNYLQETGDAEIFWYGFGAVVILGFPVIVHGYFNGVFQAYGVFPHQNSLGVYMVIAGPLLLARALLCRDRIRTVFYGLAFVLAGISTVLTYSRGSLLCLPIGCMITVAVTLRYRFSMRALAVTGGLMVVGFLGLMLMLPRIMQRFETAPAASGETRLNLAIAAMNMIEDSPIIGVGVNNWGIKINPPYEYSEHRDPQRGYYEEFKDGIVETIYLLTGAECGIPGLLWLLGWLGFYLFAAIRLLPELADTEWFYIPAGLVGGLSGVYLQSALEWVLKQPVNFAQLIIIFAVIGFLRADWKRRRRQPLVEAPSI